MGIETGDSLFRKKGQKYPCQQIVDRVIKLCSDRDLSCLWRDFRLDMFPFVHTGLTPVAVWGAFGN